MPGVFIPSLYISSTMVRTIKLNDGKEIPALAWGNGTGGIQQSGQKAVDTGVVALKAGILHIDTAQVRSAAVCLVVYTEK